ncbi:MAG: 2-hydroxyacyl-CoA dehydratase family protein [Thermodesulfobacteriota bacterium]
MTSELVEPFTRALAERPKSEDQRFIGWFCTYTPVELILAAGFTPVRITGGGEATGQADLLTPGFLCPYLRRAVEKGLAGEYGFLSGIVQGYTCDAACGLVNIWAENIGGLINHTLPLPYQDSPAAREFLRACLIELAEKLEAAGGEFSITRLEEASALYTEIREMALVLYERRYRGGLDLSAREFLDVVRAGQVTPPEEYRNHMRELLVALEDRPIRPGRPVLVSGSVIEEPRVLDILEECGGRVAADDLCSGWRGLVPPAGAGADPLARLVDRYMRRAPCPARSRAEDRAAVIFDLLGKSRAEGVIFLLQKFCTPHLGDLPTLTDLLKAKGLPVLVVELEETGVSEGQLRTRFESFFEIMEP